MTMNSTQLNKLTRRAVREARVPRRAATHRRAPRTRALFGGNGGNVLDNLLKGDPAGKTKKEYEERVAAVGKLEPAIKALDDDALRAKTDELKARVAAGTSLDDVLVEAFAVAREASVRVLGLRPFDVQLMGGMILHEGQIAEMRTGEGKTLVAILPSYLNALAGKGVHVVTVNDYLARRDCEWVGQVLRYLGLSVGLIQSGNTNEQRRMAYASDVTYVTNSELGFDYLRDNLCTDSDDLVLRKEGNFFCVIDEVDSILVDEARTPLIISGEAEKPSSSYVKANKLAEALSRDVHYTVDEKQKSVLITDEGYEAAEEVLGVSDLYDPRTQWASYLLNALKAKELQERDVQYIVKGNEVVIVDEFTGRTMEGRRWSDGLHQAVEAKEGVEIQKESVTLASVSYQSFFLGYPRISGMTGTAATEMTEFENIYGLPVRVVPTNRDNSREDFPDVVFKTEKGKWNAVRTEVTRMHKKGRPVLIGTTSVEQSEFLGDLLDEVGVPYQLLNAKPENVQRESEIVGQAGRAGQVTIATNMAGRGTDIILGGNAEVAARLKLRDRLIPKLNEMQGNSGGAATSGGDLPFEKKGKKAREAEATNANIVNALGNGDRPFVATNPAVFPCEIPDELLKAVDEACVKAVSTWREAEEGGVLSMDVAEDRLALATEKAPSDDAGILALRKVFNQVEELYEEVTSTEKAEVLSLGGLHVIGTERHESRRIDNQLRGRGGRQGDKGSTRFFLSLEDKLFRIFGGDNIKNMMSMFALEEDVPIESGMLSSSLDSAQKKVETYYYDIRKSLFDYDQVLNIQRVKVYKDRRTALFSAEDELVRTMEGYAAGTVDDIVYANIDPSVPSSEWDLEAIVGKFVQYCYVLDPTTAENDADKALREEFDVDVSVEDVAKLVASAQSGSRDPVAAAEAAIDAMRDYFARKTVAAYRYKRKFVENVEDGLMEQAERFFVLTQTDNLWKRHLEAMRFIQQAVGLRGYAQRDPLTEYKLEGYELFQEMQAQVRRNVIYSVYQFKAKRIQPEQIAAAEAEAEAAEAEQPEKEKVANNK
ncbi:protein translocase subunit SecA [Pycnococcus provasolii]